MFAWLGGFQEPALRQETINMPQLSSPSCCHHCSCNLRRSREPIPLLSCRGLPAKGQAQRWGEKRQDMEVAAGRLEKAAE